MAEEEEIFEKDIEEEVLQVKKRITSLPEEDESPHDHENWMGTEENEFWEYFFQLIDYQDGCYLQGEFKTLVHISEGRGIYWNFWTGPRSASYTLALKKTIDRIHKIGGFTPDETKKLKMLAEKVIRTKKALLRPSTKTHDPNDYFYQLWVGVRKSLNNQPLDFWRVANCFCDVLLGLIAVTVFSLFMVGIYTVIFKSK